MNKPALFYISQTSVINLYELSQVFIDKGVVSVVMTNGNTLMTKYKDIIDFIKDMNILLDSK